MNYDVVGISHTLIDLCAEINDTLLFKHNLIKGTMHLVDDNKFHKIHDELNKNNMKVDFGGSVSNTLDGLHLLGCQVAEFATVGNDEYGQMIIDQINKKGIGNFISKHDLPTGSVLSLITPDSERTMVVCLGAASQLSQNDILPEIIQNCKIIHITGYEFESPIVKSAVNKAVKIAKENDILISFDLADPELVRRNLPELKLFIKQNVDILFANEEETREFTGKSPNVALEIMGQDVNYAIVKTGVKGSMIKIRQTGEKYNIGINEVVAKDTTGAGDMYSACILYGIINNIDLSKAGEIAAFLASKVVEKSGARLESIDISNFIK